MEKGSLCARKVKISIRAVTVTTMGSPSCQNHLPVALVVRKVIRYR